MRHYGFLSPSTEGGWLLQIFLGGFSVVLGGFSVPNDFMGFFSQILLMCSCDLFYSLLSLNSGPSPLPPSSAAAHQQTDSFQSPKMS